VRFEKWDALGNVYLVVDRRDLGRALAGEDARRLCDRARGTAADGVLEIVSTDPTSAEVAVWNPDGSRAEFSGNGARIAARWLAERAGRRDVRLRFGARDVRAAVDGDTVVVDVGHVDVGVPETIEVAGTDLELTRVSVGNPHAVVRIDFEEDDLLRLGPAIEGHERFPGRTNVQLVRVVGPHEIAIGVWERGAGRTRSSGSSSVAAAAAALANGWCASPVTVIHPGAGELLVALEPEGERSFRASLTGPARRIGDGDSR
jgi:diaminopimelate epimerase